MVGLGVTLRTANCSPPFSPVLRSWGLVSPVLPRSPPLLRLDNATALLKGPPACGLPGQQRPEVVLPDVLPSVPYTPRPRGGVPSALLSLPRKGGVACVGALGSGFAPERFHDLSNGLL